MQLAKITITILLFARFVEHDWGNLTAPKW